MGKHTLKQSGMLCFFSMSVIASEIALTRIFNVVFWYHFGFLILSTAMLGFGIGGLLVQKWRERLSTHDPDRIVVWGVFVSGMALLVTLFVISHNPFHVNSLTTSPKTVILWTTFQLITTSIALILPFTLMGATILFILQHRKKNISLFYAANLMGSGLGCCVAILLLNAGGGLKTILALITAITLATALYSFETNKKFSAIAVFTAVTLITLIPFSDTLFPLKSPLGKPAARIQQDTVVYSDWTSLSKIDIFKETETHGTGTGLWGLSPENLAQLPERLGILIDYWAYTTIIKHSEQPGYYDFLDNLPMYSVYTIAPESPEVLIIGAGGGMDIRAALENNAKKIDAVEINPSIYRAMNNQFADYSGGVYLHDNVKSHLSEGRRFLESTKATYDIIQLSGVDTCSSTQAGAFALTENFLYTKEAFNLYLDHLKNDGILTLTHWYIPTLKGFPRFSLRMFTLAVESLETQGIQQPWNNVVYFQSNRFSVLLAKKTPFSRQDINRIETLVQEKSYYFLYRPDKTVFSSIKFYSFIKAKDRNLWYEHYPFNVAPPLDDSPFYFENRKLSNLFKTGEYNTGYTRFDGQTILVMLLIEMIIVSGVLIYLSLNAGNNSMDVTGWLYFFVIGMGFMLVEVTFSQQLVLFLGHPVYALSVVMFSILIFSGTGSVVSERLTKTIKGSYWLMFAAALLVFQAISGPHVIGNSIGAQSTFIRILMAVCWLAPVSILMGIAFPEAVRRIVTISKNGELGVYWAWNSVASVVASVLAVMIAIESGFKTVMMTAALCYLMAAVLLPRIGRKT